MLNLLDRSLPMPVTPPGQPVLVYGVIVHSTGARPPAAAGTNQPSSRTPSDIVTAISWQPAADAGAAWSASAARTSTSDGRPLRSPIAPILGAAFAACRSTRPRTTKPPTDRGLRKHRYRDSNPGFRRERAAS